MALIECVVDGAARGQGAQGKIPQGAAAVVIYQNKKLISQFSRGLGECTNNEAEYEAVICGILMCAMAGHKDPIIYSDSAVVVNQVNDQWVCKSARLMPLLATCNILKEEYNFRLLQVPREFVGVADTLANRFLDELEAKIATQLEE